MARNLNSPQPGDPRQAPTVPAKEYVGAIANHVASVCVITALSGGERYGLTATAVSSVCAEPPRISICVNKSGVTHEMIRRSGFFCVNVLSEDQDRVAKAFAGMVSSELDRFSVGEWTTLVSGAPALAGGVAALDCRVVETYEQSTHTLFIGDVIATSSQPGRDTLLYGARRFRQLRKIFLALADDESEYL